MPIQPTFSPTGQAALKALVASLPDSALARLQHLLTTPSAHPAHLDLQYPRIRLILALAALAPVQLNDLARHLHRDRSNTYHSLQRLVSLGLVTRYKQNSKVYYQLPESPPLPVESDSK